MLVKTPFWRSPVSKLRPLGSQRLHTNNTPSQIKLKKNKRELEITWPNGEVFSYPAELLRIESPSAEVRGHSIGEKKVNEITLPVLTFKLVDGKEDVSIVNIEPRGNYAIGIFFDDMHDSGIYSWDFLCDLYLKKDDIMEKYIKDLEKAGKSRASPFKRKKASE